MVPAAPVLPAIPAGLEPPGPPSLPMPPVPTRTTSLPAAPVLPATPGPLPPTPGPLPARPVEPADPGSPPRLGLLHPSANSERTPMETRVKARSERCDDMLSLLLGRSDSIKQGRRPHTAGKELHRKPRPEPALNTAAGGRPLGLNLHCFVSSPTGPGAPIVVGTPGIPPSPNSTGP